jgi:hypothetical protein
VSGLGEKFLRRKTYSLRNFFLYALTTLLWASSTPASPEEMIPTSFEPMKARSQTGRVTVTGGQESIAVGRPHITNQAFAQALVASIKKFQTFSNVIEDQGSGEEYLLTVHSSKMFSFNHSANRCRYSSGLHFKRADSAGIERIT